MDIVTLPPITKGSTGVIIPIGLSDSTSGQGISLNYNAATLTAAYIRQGEAAPTSITLSDGVLGTWSSGGFKLTSATVMRGAHEFGVPNACLLTGANYCMLEFKGATGMRDALFIIPLIATNPQTATNGGMTDIAAIKLKTDLIVSGTVTVATPVSLDGTTVTLIKGDDYKAAESRAVTFTSTNWPSSLATATNIALRVAGIKDYNFTASSATVVTRDFTATETAELTVGTYDFQLIATLLNGDIVTLAQGLQPDGGFVIAPRVPAA